MFANIRRLPISALALALAAALSAGRSAAQDSPEKPPAAQPEPAAPRQIYNEKADARELIDAALRRAQRDNTRVLIMYGGNWCGWCHKLHHLFGDDGKIARLLQYEYELVMVDIGRFDKHMDIAAGYGADLKKSGVPCLTILAADGKVLANQETGALEDGPKHDPGRVFSFLDQHKAPPRDAELAYDEAVRTAAAEGKRVFVHLGAPWCGWCKRLDEFLETPKVREIFTLDFYELKIDVDRMENGKRVAERLRSNPAGGIPWFAVLDEKGGVQFTSDGPGGNIGYPVKPDEIEHFLKTIKSAARTITADQLATLETVLKQRAEQIERPSRTPP